MVDPIVTKGAKVLAQRTKEVPKELFGSKELGRILKHMSASLRATSHGVAIAANQIGLSYRIFVVRGFVMAGKERSDEDVDVAFVNPKISKLSRKKELMDEACLSVPGLHGAIKRSLLATVTAYNEKGKKFERGASGLLAQIFQHETDHLEGILYVDKAEEVLENPPEENETPTPEGVGVPTEASGKKHAEKP
ncbi:peptide deformylase [Candidatus Kaiserbacteria bacterium]|nr:peptide deformylase [Candidatus Kaiserbacteria bacterium]